MKNLFLFLFTFSLVALSITDVDAQSRRSKRNQQRKIQQQGQFQGTQPTIHNTQQYAPSGPCQQAVDPMYYGVGVYKEDGTLMGIKTSGSIQIPNAGTYKIYVFGDFGWNTNLGTNNVYESDLNATLTPCVIDIVPGQGTAKQAIGYYYDNYVSDFPLLPVYFGTDESLNVSGAGAAPIKSIKIGTGCKVTAVGPPSTSSIPSITPNGTYTASLSNASLQSKKNLTRTR